MNGSESGVLKDRVVVITGGARGMGRAYTLAFLAAGAKVVSTDRSWAGTEPPGDELTAGGKNILIADMDVTNEDQLDRVYASTIERFGTVDVLINNAALRQRDLFPPTGRTTTLETKDSDWEKSFAVNVFGDAEGDAPLHPADDREAPRQHHQHGQQRHPAPLARRRLHGVAAQQSRDALSVVQGGARDDELLSRRRGEAVQRRREHPRARATRARPDSTNRTSRA